MGSRECLKSVRIDCLEWKKMTKINKKVAPATVDREMLPCHTPGNWWWIELDDTCCEKLQICSTAAPIASFMIVEEPLL